MDPNLNTSSTESYGRAIGRDIEYIIKDIPGTFSINSEPLTEKTRKPSHSVNATIGSSNQILINTS